MINYLRKYTQNMTKYIIIDYISCIIGQNYPKKTLRHRPKYHGNSQHIVISMLLTSMFLYGISVYANDYYDKQTFNMSHNTYIINSINH
jgi:hypothetical protein